MSPLTVKNLVEWFLDHKRDLPWRRKPDPYAVWISEVMLQQTRVAVVIPYFTRWMARFPTVKSLAESSLDDVIKMWEGLGYYSRARNIHEGARLILERHQGKIPGEEEALGQVKGLGPYTIGAILSFAFHKKKAAVDGNVIRVLTRFFHIEDDVGKASTLRKLRLLVESFLPEKESRYVNEGLIELGATVCQKKPQCSRCPLREECKSYLLGVSERFPIKKKPVPATYLYRVVALIKSGDSYLIRRCKEGEIMQDLHEFPFFETDRENMEETKAKNIVENHYGPGAVFFRSLSDVFHSFTRYRVQLKPVIFSCSVQPVVEDAFWVHETRMRELAFSSGHRKILQLLEI